MIHYWLYRPRSQCPQAIQKALAEIYEVYTILPMSGLRRSTESLPKHLANINDSNFSSNVFQRIQTCYLGGIYIFTNATPSQHWLEA